jgi:UDP-glucuronate 4-epimerase
MNILVTGAAGFIGSHVCEQLLRSDHEVKGIDNFDPFYDPVIKENNVSILSRFSKFKFYRQDIRNADQLDSIFSNSKIDLVIHLAAKAGVRPSIQNPADYMDVNVTGLCHVLEASKNYGVKRFIFASSSSVYGNQKKTPFSESDDVSYPISPYSASKRSGELICKVYHHLYQLEVACLRLFTVYGPRQRPDLAIHKFTELALHDKPIELYGDGSTLRDYTYISDIVDGITAVMQMDNLGYQIFNLGNGNPVKLKDMIDAIQSALQIPIQIQYKDMQAGDVDMTHADISKASQLLNYSPKISLGEGVRQFMEWYKNSMIPK